MKANQGSGNWFQYLGATALLGFIGYAVFQVYGVPEDIFKTPLNSETAQQQESAVSTEEATPEGQQSATVVEIADQVAVEDPSPTGAEESHDTGKAQVEAEAAIVEMTATDIEETDIAMLDEPDDTGTAPQSPADEETDTDAPLVPESIISAEPEHDAIPIDAPSEPKFDLVRLDASGTGLVAGRADPGTTVRVLSNGIDVGTAEVSNSGEFVAFVQIPENDEGQSLTLVALGADETSVSTGSVDRVLVLPSEDANDEAQAPTLVKASKEDVRVIQPGGLGQIDGVSLDSISYDQSGDVVLAGRGRSGDALRIYVDNSATAEAVVSPGGTWEARFSSVKEGRYILRVDAQDASGKVSSRVESPFQRVYPTAEQLAAPSKITVQPGNSLWLMATERYGSGHLYTQIYAANQDTIRDPDLIYPGQIFEMPSVDTPDADERP